MLIMPQRQILISYVKSFHSTENILLHRFLILVECLSIVCTTVH